jgi:putative ABC transport system permease protein
LELPVIATAPTIPLDAADLAVAAALVAVAGVVSLALGLRMERRLVTALARTMVQLLLVGYVLTWVFDLTEWPLVLGLFAFMASVAGLEAVRRSSRTFRGVRVRALATLLLTATLTTFTVTEVVIGVDPWFSPRYVIPLLGMVLGNGLNGVSLCLDTLLETIDERRDRIEMELSLGATRWEALRDPLADSVRRGMIPITNSMMVAGLVSLPGMMTGQILAGQDPLLAVKYQIVVMCMLCAATSLGCVLIGVLVLQRLTNHRHQLLTSEVQRRSAPTARPRRRRSS